jgi:hypothetical protein
MNGKSPEGDRVPCTVCLDLDRTLEHDDSRWRYEIKEDLTAEHSLEFESSQLELSANAGCATCLIVRDGFKEFVDRVASSEKLEQYRGRFILQSDCPLEVEILDQRQNADSDSDVMARVQYYTLEGL